MLLKYRSKSLIAGFPDTVSGRVRYLMARLAPSCHREARGESRTGATLFTADGGSGER
jgi:hypothetical protein